MIPENNRFVYKQNRIGKFDFDPIRFLLNYSLNFIEVLLRYLRFYRFSDLFHIEGRFKARDDIALAVDQEFCEIPFDVRLVAVGLVVSIGKLVECFVFEPLAEALKRLLCREEREKRVGGIAVNIDLFELREIRAELGVSQSPCRAGRGTYLQAARSAE